MPRGESRDATAQPHVAASPAQQEDHVQQHTDGSMDPFDESGGAALDAFTSAIESDPAAILQPIPQLGNLAKSAVKVLYDHQAQDQHTTGSAGCLRGGGGGVVLPELYVDGFDAEQIWLQLDLAIKPALKRARKLLSKAGQDPVLLTREAEDALDELLVLERSSSEEQDTEGDADDALLAEDFSEDNATATADLASIDYDALLQAGAAQFSRRRPQDTSSSDDEGEAQLAKQQQQSTRGRKANSATAVRATVEDDHFKLDEMEAFVQQAEREEAGLETGENDGDAATSDEEADLEAVLDQVAASSGRGGKLKQGHKRKLESVGDLVDDEQLEEMGAAAMYEDFFGPRLGSRFTVSPQSGEDARGRGLGGADTDGIGSSDDDEDGFNDDLLSGDMLSGEDDEQGGGESSMELRDRGTALEGRSTVDVEGHDLLADSDEEEAEEEQAPSAHQRRQQRLQEKIRRLEEVALGEKDWFMRGEVDAGRRPKNSALEVDLDFETTVKPPPQPTEEMTRTLDELIKARIAEGRFDDVVRIEPPAPEAKRTAVELDDRKPPQGLGELYEQEYMQAVTGAAADKDEEVRQQARAQLAVLFAKLDSLSHLHFTPRPVMEEVAVKVDVPAIMMEEAAPQYVSGASMQAPEEVFATGAGGAPHAEEELTREERKRRRAQRKRAGKNRRAAKEEQRAQNPSLAGRKSAAEQEAARKMVKTAGMGRAASSSRTNSEYGRSNAVFAKIQGGGTFAAKQAGAPAPIEHLKL